ncbi:hypothetical protein NLO413_0283 [Candidatus Neoehrlichia lotoris str. RAC413]|uniref:Uncharacterized protein n=1 Tax=Candidatus Neoehrlichia procyonis str. RAC413 TaxID=1359163 RepID=A0A0F3NMH8_9RICK|nr:hypothetical protein NLO413_0283 [Candidatus Neoehrlichia lotoris str. RAC413]
MHIITCFDKNTIIIIDNISTIPIRKMLSVIPIAEIIESTENVKSSIIICRVAVKMLSLIFEGFLIILLEKISIYISLILLYSKNVPPIIISKFEYDILILNIRMKLLFCDNSNEAHNSIAIRQINAMLSPRIRILFCKLLGNFAITIEINIILSTPKITSKASNVRNSIILL